jgi:hypothetical protein
MNVVSLVLEILEELTGNLGHFVPAIKDPHSKRVYRGQRGMTHADIAFKNNLDKSKYDRNIDLGFYHHGEKKFFSRDDSTRLYGVNDSSELMTPHQYQRMKLGYNHQWHEQRWIA